MEPLRSLLVLVAAGTLFSGVAYILRVEFKLGWRLAILESFVVFGVLVWFITETLSALKAITLVGLAVCWGLVSLVCLVAAVRVAGGSPKRIVVAEVSALRAAARSVRGVSSLMLAFVLLSAVTLALIAFTTAPNNWDSMTYHLSRVMHWQQNQSLDFYATSIQRQLSFGPMAEMAILNYQILAGGDRLANFVQFFAMLGCVVGVSLIAERLGGGRNAQYFAALATMTLPMGILQATSTQNDYVVSLWCVCFTVLVLVQLEEERHAALVPLIGAALGLAMLTKLTAALFLPWIGIWMCVGLVRRNGFAAWRPLLSISAVVILIAAPQAARNYGLYGNPLGLSAGWEVGKLTNDAYSLPILASNILRNTGLHLVSPSDDLNRIIEAIIKKAHSLMRVDLNDPRTSWHRFRFEMNFSMFDDRAGNPLHLLLVIATAILLIRTGASKAAILMLCLAAGFLAFCLLLKWQPWHTRLHLPLFILAMPLAAVAFYDRLPQRLVHFSGLVLAVAAIPYLVANPGRPLFGTNGIFTKDRLAQYFTEVPDDFAVYDEAARVLQDLNCTRIGLASAVNDREYLIWATTRAYSPDTSVEHILVNNVSRRFETDSTPCAIIVTYPVQGPEMTYHDRVFVRAIDTAEFKLFLITQSPH